MKIEPVRSKRLLELQAESDINWEDHKLRLEILRVLFDARAWRSGERGANGFAICGLLRLQGFQLFDPAMRWLRENGYAAIGDREFVITDAGQDFLKDHLPGISPRPPWGGGFDGRGNHGDTTSPSRVPKRPYPLAGAGEIELPLPAEED